MSFGKRRTIAGVIFVVVGETDGADRFLLEGAQHLISDMTKTRVNKEIADEIGGNLETERFCPTGGDPDSRDLITNLIGPDPGALN